MTVIMYIGAVSKQHRGYIQEGISRKAGFL